MRCSKLGLPVLHYLPGFAQTHVHLVSDAIQPSHPLSIPSPPTFNLSQHQGLPSESALHIRWPKYWSFSFNISPSKDDSGLISYRTDPEQNYILSSILFLLQGIPFPLYSKTSIQTNSDTNTAFIQSHQC